MKRIVLFFIVIQLLSCAKKIDNNNFKIKNGKLDLYNYNFNDTGNIYLNGMWEFRWLDNENRELIEVPSTWDEDNYSNFGYGLYTLEINHNNTDKLGLYLERTHSSYEMYINDKLLLSNGRPGSNKEETIPSNKPKLVELPMESPIIIKWKISNYHHYNGGAFYTPVIGLHDDLVYKYNLSKFIDALIIGALLIMFIYYLVLFLRKKNEKAHLYFSLLCFFAFARTISSKHFLQILIPFNSVLFYKMVHKIDYLCVVLSGFNLLILFIELLPSIFNRKVIKTFLYIWLICSVFVLLSPMLIYQRIYMVFGVLMIITIALVVMGILKSINNGNKKFIIILTGCIFLLTTVINDVLIINNLIKSIYLTHIGIFIFILSNSILISDKFAIAFSKAEYLTVNLGKEVKKTTRIIEDQKNELQEIYNNKTSYFVNISHEIRTPLTLIKNYMDKYIEEVGNEKNLVVVKNNIDMLVRNITNIFNLQSIELGKIRYNHNNIVDIKQHINDKIMLLKSSALNKKIILTTNITNDNAYIQIDTVAFDNIINNLFENAIKYTPEFGKIIISVTAAENTEITIFNSGDGISESQIENLYNPCYQKGIGLGLSIVKKILDEVKGTIKVKSKPGIGTEFCVIFKKTKPAITKTDSASVLNSNYPNEHITPSLKPDKYSVERFNILIIETNNELLYNLQDIFYDDYNVFCAINDSDALNLLSYIPRPDLIISDVAMDNIDGFGYLEYIPLIFLTADAGNENKLEYLKTGAVDYLYKPIDKSELILKVSSILKITRDVDGVSKKVDERHLELEKLYSNFGVSKRQIEIISLLKEGLERKQIASELEISLNTVKTQLQRLYEKCDVNNKTELIKIFN